MNYMEQADKVTDHRADHPAYRSRGAGRGGWTGQYDRAGHDRYGALLLRAGRAGLRQKAASQEGKGPLQPLTGPLKKSN